MATVPLTKAARGSLFDINVDHRTEVPINYGSSMLIAFEPSEQARKHKKVAYENTYRTAPEQKFKPNMVRPIITRTLAQLEGMEYDAEKCSALSRQLADEIKYQVKALKFDRYKILCLVTIGQKSGHCVNIGSRFLWDEEKDSFTEETWSNRHMYAVGCVYGLYQE